MVPFATVGVALFAPMMSIAKMVFVAPPSMVHERVLPVILTHLLARMGVLATPLTVCRAVNVHRVGRMLTVQIERRSVAMVISAEVVLPMWNVSLKVSSAEMVCAHCAMRAGATPMILM